jgi:hypothetical protein
VKSSFSCKVGTCRNVRSRTCTARHDPSQARCLRPCERCRRLGKEALIVSPSVEPFLSLHRHLGGVKGGKRLRCAMRSRLALPLDGRVSALPAPSRDLSKSVSTTRARVSAARARDAAAEWLNTHTSHPSTGSLRKVNSSLIRIRKW